MSAPRGRSSGGAGGGRGGGGSVGGRGTRGEGRGAGARATSGKAAGGKAAGGRGAGGKASGGRGAGGKAAGGKAPGGRGAGGKAAGGKGAGTSRSGAGRSPGGRGAPGRSDGRVGAGATAGGVTGRGGRPPQAKPRGLGGEQVEGRQAVRELLLAGKRRIREVLVADDQDDTEVLQDIVDLAGDLRVAVRLVSRNRLAGVARTEAPQGVVAMAAPLPEHDLDELATAVDGRPAPFLVAVDGVTDPGNLGALLRTAECAGVTGVVLPRHRAVHVTPTVTKAAAGAVEHLPMTLVGGLPTALTQLRKHGVWVVGLDAGGDVPLFDLLVASEPVCLVLGAEGHGLSRLVRQRCDTVASIPLQGAVGSLNVSVAGALACFEVVRRRLAATGDGA